MRVAIDSGGTFTDAVFFADGSLRILKVPSTPHNPAEAISAILDSVRAQYPATSSEGSLELLYGTTVGTNALLERRGGRAALVTTAGFEDVLEIGRQARPRLYDWFVERPAPLVPASRRMGLRARMGTGGKVLVRPSRRELQRIARAARKSGAQAVAVCLLFSYANPAHERAVGAALKSAGLLVSLSCEVLPEFREYERTATTVVNAYLLPLVSSYLGEVSRRASASWPAASSRGAASHERVRVMQSNGGIISADAAAREPVRTILSGPAGGVLGAEYVARAAGMDRVISFDMGGTSTDVALLEGTPRTTNEAVVAGLPVAVPVLDIHTVGAGGGSLARFDKAGALRVGPESAGADPGPACYGRGERPTVTDAQFVLRRISSDGFLGGEFRLDPARARRAIESLLRSAPPGGAARLRTVEQLAQGIVDVANAAMEKAIRVISIERGHDPRDYALVAFGGAGGLHACDLAAALRLPQVLVPCLPGGLSALGILRADVVKEYVRTVQVDTRSSGAARQVAIAFSALERDGARELASEGFRGPAQVRVERMLDCRYSGQGYELTVPAARTLSVASFVAAFHRAHQQRYGYSDSTRPVEVVNVRARVAGLTPKPGLARQHLAGPSAAAARVALESLYVNGKRVPAAFYDRARLRAGNRFRGPAVVNEYGATTFLPPGWVCRVDTYGNLLLAQEKK